MKTKRLFSLFRKISILIVLFSLSSSVLIGQSIGDEKPACPKIDKSKSRKKAKELKTQRSGNELSVSKYSYEHGESIPNYM